MGTVSNLPLWLISFSPSSILVKIPSFSNLLIYNPKPQLWLLVLPILQLTGRACDNCGKYLNVLGGAFLIKVFSHILVAILINVYQLVHHDFFKPCDGVIFEATYKAQSNSLCCHSCLFPRFFEDGFHALDAVN